MKTPEGYLEFFTFSFFLYWGILFPILEPSRAVCKKRNTYMLFFYKMFTNAVFCLLLPESHSNRGYRLTRKRNQFPSHVSATQCQQVEGGQFWPLPMEVEGHEDVERGPPIPNPLSGGWGSAPACFPEHLRTAQKSGGSLLWGQEREYGGGHVSSQKQRLPPPQGKLHTISCSGT